MCKAPQWPTTGSGPSRRAWAGARQEETPQPRQNKQRAGVCRSVRWPTSREQLMLTVEPHPLLDLRAFVTEFPRPLGEMASTQELLALLTPAAPAPLRSDDGVREAVRQLLRQGGFKPTGRSKPASEYLLKATADDRLTSINVAVDVCNVVSLHSGLPISVVNLDRARGPFRVALAPARASYVFNPSGPSIAAARLSFLSDAVGPGANAGNAAQRTH